MKKILFTLLLSIIISDLSFGQQTCSSAQVILAGQLTIPAINGTQIPAINCILSGSGGSAANWYKYTPTENHNVTVTSNFISNGNTDNRVRVYSGSCGALICEAGNDDNGSSLLCVVNFNAVANTDYFIVFDNLWSSNGFMFELIENVIVLPDTNLVAFVPVNISTISGSSKNAITDMNGDFLDDIVAVSNTNIQVHYQDTAGNFTIGNFTTTTAQFMPSWSIAIGDYNNDGYNDLLYGGGSGVTFMKSNGLGTGYTQTSGSQYVFSQRSNFVDMNNDGNLDAFVCHDVAPNVYYLNDGNGNLSFNQGGVGDHPNGGNYGSIWIDYNNDGFSDLFISKCRGGSGTAKINELHRNNGNGTFTNVSTQSNLADPIQTWSSACNDFDNDGWIDIIVCASSSSDGMHKFMRNNGNGTFSNITAGSGIDTFNGLNIENVSYDFNNDGFADVFTNNVILYNNGNNTFTARSVPMSVGAVGDLNSDGFLDVQNGNLIYYNTANANNWLCVTLQGTSSNRNGIGARVEIYGAWGKQIRDVQAGIGFRNMGTLNTHFGIGTATQIDSVIVRWPSGNVDVICNPTKNIFLNIIENSGSVAIADFSVNTNVIFESESVEFTDASSTCPTAWNWSVDPSTGWEFSNGTSLTSQNPTITFNLSGTYVVSLIASNGNGSSINQSTDTILVDLSVGINKNNILGISVYPNPVEDLINIRLNQSQIRIIKIVSILGIELEANFNKSNNTILVSHLNAGTYFLLFTTETGQVMVTRFIKK